MPRGQGQQRALALTWAITWDLVRVLSAEHRGRRNKNYYPNDGDEQVGGLSRSSHSKKKRPNPDNNIKFGLIITQRVGMPAFPGCPGERDQTDVDINAYMRWRMLETGPVLWPLCFSLCCVPWKMPTCRRLTFFRSFLISRRMRCLLLLWACWESCAAVYLLF